MINQKTRNAIFIALSLLLVISLVSGLVYYFNYQIELARQDYDSKISGLNRALTASLQNMQLALENRIIMLGSNLSSQIGFVDTNLQSFKKQNQQEINTLSSLIEQIEKQSSIRLNELKDDLKNIKIKSIDFSAIVEDSLQSVVSVSTNTGQGSGAIIDAKGYIVTNVHVISGALAIRATTYSGKIYDVDSIAGYDQAADIAVLKINAPDLKALELGNSNDVRVGEKVIAAGNPAGLAFTVTEGIVSAFRTAPNGIKYIQTDVPINPGNSGGPLINIKGEIIGINNFKVGGFESLGFAISSNEVKRAVDKIIGEFESKIVK